MQLALCNEVIRELDFVDQCKMVGEIGYQAIEIAPFTLSEEPHLLSQQERQAIKDAAAKADIFISSLHWLLLTPKGLSITAEDQAVRRRTIEVMKGLVKLCADLGGQVLIHGSPKQRSIMNGQNPAHAYDLARDCFREVAKAAEEHGVIYCIEPLSRQETSLINTVAEASQLVDEIDSPAFQTMIDTSAAANTEEQEVATLIHKWLPTGKIRHIHLNDRNRCAPGLGDDDFSKIISALRTEGYDRVAAVEPFVYDPDGPTVARSAFNYLNNLMAMSQS